MPERSDRKFEDQFRRQQAEKDAALQEKKIRAKLYAERVLRTFNACAHRGIVPAFFPTIRCCLVAEWTRLETECPGCRTIKHSHLDKLGENLHPLATVAVLLFKIRCGRCGDDAPLSRIIAINHWTVGIPKVSLEKWGGGAAYYADWTKRKA